MYHTCGPSDLHMRTQEAKTAVVYVGVSVLTTSENEKLKRFLKMVRKSSAFYLQLHRHLLHWRQNPGG